MLKKQGLILLLSMRFSGSVIINDRYVMLYLSGYFQTYKQKEDFMAFLIAMLLNSNLTVWSH